jgi:hypothetical protein
MVTLFGVCSSSFFVLADSSSLSSALPHFLAPLHPLTPSGFTGHIHRAKFLLARNLTGTWVGSMD